MNGAIIEPRCYANLSNEEQDFVRTMFDGPLGAHVIVSYDGKSLSLQDYSLNDYEGYPFHASPKDLARWSRFEQWPEAVGDV